MLRGNALAKIDEKGRLKLPSSFRAILEPKYGGTYFVTSLRGDCVRVYPMEVWMRLEEKLGQTSSLNPSITRFKNAVNYYGQTASMDSQGRLLIHPLVRERGEVRGDVVVLGQQDYLEVWNRAAFESRLASDPLTDGDLEFVAGLGV